MTDQRTELKNNNALSRCQTYNISSLSKKFVKVVVKMDRLVLQLKTSMTQK